jgi:DNA-directed RNA polymerase subunit F
MVKPIIIQTSALNCSEVKEELATIRKRDSDLNFRARKTEEYLTTIPTMPTKKAKELFDELTKLNIPRIKDSHLQKFVDVMPVSIDDAKNLFAGQTISINNDNLKKMVETLDKYR